MKAYEIRDKELKLQIGILLYYENDCDFVIELNNRLTEWEAPLLFYEFVKAGSYTIPREAAGLWAAERVIPSGRQNIKDILDTHHLSEYDEFKFLELSKGKCSQDSMYLRKIDLLPDYVIERQCCNLLDVTPLSGFRLLCLFNDGKAKVVSLEKLLQEEGATMDVSSVVPKVISNEKLFNSVSVSPGGYAVTFNNSIDIPKDVLYKEGRALELSADDFKSFVKFNVLSTSECCDVLECSRQNLSYLTNQNKLESIKKFETGSLYLKGNVLKTQW